MSYSEAASPVDHRLLKIGEVAKQSGIGVESLRFYESRGLLEPACRTPTGYRLYGASVLERLTFIKKAQKVGFSLDEIAWIIAESKSGRAPCQEVRRLAAERLAGLESHLAELTRYRDELKETVEAWNQAGEAEGHICGLIESLALETTSGSQGAPARHARRSAPHRRR